MNDFLDGLTFFAALGCGLMAGVFFAFSSFVMKALGRRPTREAIASMQAINETAINPLFMAAFMGTAAVCGLVVIASLAGWSGVGAVYQCIGGVTYVVGAVGVTMACNVPRNNRLAAVAPEDAASANQWASYRQQWTVWNHVRMVAALVAAAVLMSALCY